MIVTFDMRKKLIWHYLYVINIIFYVKILTAVFKNAYLGD